ncbi:MAG: sigma-70 family RNA polymerase sigma factor [Candidatus Competibacteraceae bacterium]|nr:sigma-70 family RNA polymerase sigma factor [Candidatus Competibacteraceae bacterium]
MDVNNPQPHSSLSDHELVLRAVHHSDQGAYTELLDRYRDSIYYLFVKMVNNKDDAEDLTIETFGKAFRNLHNYQPTFAFSTWLYRIATNNGIDFLRKKKISTFSIDNPIKNKDGDQFEINISGNTPDPEETMIREQKKEVLRQFVDKLKPRYKQLIELRYYEDLSYEEIANRLGLPLGTVKAQLFRAKDLLYQIIHKTKGRF